MLSTPFGPHIISYKPPKVFMVPKFTMYDRISGLFNHLIQFLQIMTLDIGNDVLLCKVFPTNFHGPTLFWFHQLSQNPINTFGDVSKAFVGHYLCSVQQKPNISTLQNIQM